MKDKTYWKRNSALHFLAYLAKTAAAVQEYLNLAWQHGFCLRSVTVGSAGALIIVERNEDMQNEHRSEDTH